MFQLDNPDKQTPEQFERFGFERRAHTADKVGDYANQWRGEILLTTTVPDLDELQAARNFEALVISGSLPMHGNGWRLAYINFNFSPSGADKEALGQNITCMVRVGYKSEVKPLREPELIERLQLMGVPVQFK